MAAVSSAVVVGNPPAPQLVSLGDSPATNASIAAYNRSGEQMLQLMDIAWKTCVVLFVVVAAAWLMGWLPIAVALWPR